MPENKGGKRDCYIIQIFDGQWFNSRRGQSNQGQRWDIGKNLASENAKEQVDPQNSNSETPTSQKHCQGSNPGFSGCPGQLSFTKSPANDIGHPIAAAQQH